MGRIINAVHRLNEKLITIWKSEGSHGLVYHRYLGTPGPGGYTYAFFDTDARAERELHVLREERGRRTCASDKTVIPLLDSTNEKKLTILAIYCSTN